MRQHEGLIKIKPRREDHLISKGLAGILELAYFRKTSSGALAEKFIDYVIQSQKNGNPMPISEWKSWMKANGASQSQFYGMRDHLIGLGMIRKERGTYLATKDFSRILRTMANIWDARRESVREDAEETKIEA